MASSLASRSHADRFIHVDKEEKPHDTAFIIKRAWIGRIKGQTQTGRQTLVYWMTREKRSEKREGRKEEVRKKKEGRKMKGGR